MHDRVTSSKLEFETTELKISRKSFYIPSNLAEEAFTIPIVEANGRDQWTTATGRGCVNTKLSI
ncbi:hypothetical protein V6Z12_A08G152000 [Gossypium hirsutum]